MGLQHWTWAPTGLGFISALSTGAEHRLAFFLQQVGEARGSHRTGIRTPVSTHQSWSTALLRPLLQERETELGRVTQPVTTIHFSCSVVSDSLRPHGLQHTRLPCPSPTPGVYPYPCPLSWWCHPTILSSVIPFSCPQSFPASGSYESALYIRWPKYWSFSFNTSPSNEYSGLISLRIG